MPAGVKTCRLPGIYLTRPSFEEFTMLRIVGRMMEEKAEKHSKAIMTACINLSPITS
jgi:hypothetical protein